MYASVVTAQVLPDKMDEAIRVWQGSVMPAAREQKGFKSARCLVDRKTDKIIAVVLWETEADARATGEGSAFLREQRGRFASLVTAPAVVERYEVAAEA